MSELVPVVASTMKEVYPEIHDTSTHIRKIFNDEEAQFWKTVDKAKKMFDSVAAESKSPIISGRKAFNLFETHGLPLAVTVELARNIGREVDETEFERCRLEAQKVSQKASQFKLPISADDFPSHSDKEKYSYVFRNGKYEFPQVKTRILQVYKDQQKAESLEANDRGFLVLEECQFYGEQGGQTSDTGHLLIDGREVFEVENAKKIAGGAVTVLFGRALLPIRRDLRVEQKLDETRREGVMRAHSATHLLNWALQKLGVGSGQKGSSVDCDRFRFDYSTGDEDLSKEQRTELLIKCEMKMREFIQNGGFTEIIETSLEEAKKIENLQSDVKEDRIGGASVRVVALGSGADVPVECCSGTHIHDVRVIDDVAIMSDKSMGQRLRRIIVLTGKEAAACRNYTKSIYEDLRSTDPKERSKTGKNIDWKRVPIADQARISILLKQKK